MREQLLCYALRYEGDWKKMKFALDRQEPWTRMAYEGSYVTIADQAYPDKLRRLACPPWILFYEGDMTLLQKPGCGIVGSRQASAAGLRNCARITDCMKERFVIVSGLARGIDGQAHRSALDQHTIAVIGCGLDVVYPKEHASLYAVMIKKQLIISEYPNGTKPYAYHFPWRNRIIAALSEAVIVVEARRRSGSLLTVNEALELDIPVYCVPHAYLDEAGTGCNLLISQGANILVDEDDLRLIF